MTRTSIRQPPAVRVLPEEPGVYRFRDERGRVLYLGRAGDLRHRVASYWGDLADRRHLRRMVPQVRRIEAVVCRSVHEATWLERNLLERSMPRWNRAVGGLEVETFIRVVQHRGSARLAVVHRPEPDDTALVFGPYLGGGRTRLAVDGLDRVLSLAYAADHLGGFDRDMARVRGVRAADRPARVETVAAVLGRDPVAVGALLAELGRRRDAAAGALAFEVAGRIQDEIRAVEWVTAEQMVTTRLADDALVHGWTDGLLVSFEIRGGRLRSWKQRPCAAPVAARLVATTPLEWVDFAQRGAELARALQAAEAGPA